METADISAQSANVCAVPHLAQACVALGTGLDVLRLVRKDVQAALFTAISQYSLLVRLGSNSPPEHLNAVSLLKKTSSLQPASDPCCR